MQKRYKCTMYLFPQSCIICDSLLTGPFSLFKFQALADPYFRNLAKVEREPSAQPVTKMEFEFERRRITKEDVRELIYREILEYHPKMLKEFLEGQEPTGFMYPRYICLKLSFSFSSLNLSVVCSSLHSYLLFACTWQSVHSTSV